MCDVRFNPHNYQVRAASFVQKTKRCAMHVDIGLGKTSTTLLACSDLLSTLSIRGVVVFAPLRVATISWPMELAKWDQFKHLTYRVIRGMTPESCWQLREPVDFTLINYELLPWWVEWVAAEVGRQPLPYDMLVLDESSRLKSHDSARFKALRPLADSGLFPRIVELTGTPAPESYDDLFSQYRLLDGGQRLEKKITHFRAKYQTQNPWSKFEWNLNKGADQIIQSKIADITVTIRAEEYLKMPTLLENDIYVDLPPDAQKVYAGFEDEMVAQIKDETVAAPSAAIVSEKCRQVVSGAVYDKEGKALPLHEAKFDALDELVEDGPGNLLVAYWYQHEAATIKKRYPDAPILGPGISDKLATDLVQRWNDRKIPLLFCHPASIGHGLNLQHGGHHLVWLTIPWSNELYGQTVGRLHRQGQDRPVTIHRILARKTIDQLVDKAIKDKEFNQKSLRAALAALHKG